MNRLTLLSLILAAAPAAFAQDGFIQLFNGKDFTGWKVSGNKDTFTIKDGTMVANGSGLQKETVRNILLASGGAAVGVGMGQVNRVDAARLAVARAGDRARGAVAASDAFFPFPDGLEVLIEAGVRAVVQPGGSVRDNLSIDAAAAAGVPLYMTGTRHFAH